MRTLSNIFLLIATLCITNVNIFAQTGNNAIVVKKVSEFLRSESQRTRSVDNCVVLSDDKIPLFNTYLVQLKPQGFAIVSIVNNSATIVAYSFDNNFASGSNAFEKSISLSLVQDAVLINKHEVEHGKINRNTKNVNILYGPYVHTMWGQVNCYDANGHLINVTNSFTPNHYAVGCVAVSQATIMHHYRWPPKGVGTYIDNDNSGSSRGTYTANFGKTYYSWNLMLERYRSKISTIEQREAAGELTYHVAIALKMDFEANGSTSNVNRIPTALAYHFRFTALYRSRSSSTFWSLLDSNMVYKKPIVLSVTNNSGGGHSVVCDGLKIDENGDYFYHLNMGWWGSSNGWYKIRGTFNAGGYSHVIGAAMNIIPEPYIEPPIISSDSIEFDLKWSYPEKAEADAFEVQKRVNNSSWITLTDETTDTSLHLLVDPENEYDFRVRAKTNGKWYNNSWSTITPLKRSYVGIAEKSVETISVYPNPFSSQISINTSKTGVYNNFVVVFNSNGKEIFKHRYSNSNNIVINTSLWKNGLYFIKINNTGLIKKIIKR